MLEIKFNSFWDIHKMKISHTESIKKVDPAQNLNNQSLRGRAALELLKFQGA